MQQLTQTFKLLSDESRLRILLLLLDNQLCVCQLCGILNLSQPSVSKTLARFRDLDLVEDTRQEKYIFYTLKKNQSLLLGILRGLREDIHSHPVLLQDHQRLALKDTFKGITEIGG